MNNHRLFRPLSQRHSIADQRSFEIPAENYTSLVIVTLLYFFYALYKGALRLLTYRYELSSPYSRAKLLFAFIAPVLMIAGALSSLQSIQYFSFLKSNISNEMTLGFKSLADGRDYALQFDLEKASRSFKKAELYFNHANDIYHYISPIVRTIAKALPFVEETVNNGEHALRAGLDISISARVALDTLKNFLLLQQTGTTDPMNAVILASTAFQKITPLINDASTHIALVNRNALSVDLRKYFDESSKQFRSCKETFDTFADIAAALMDSMGSSTIRRYLLVFQNNAELRASGGFIGSYALIDMMNGKIVHVEIPAGGPYDLRGSFHERLNPPEPLRLVASEWQFQDANWWADFPSSAKKILWFYEKSGGPTVDGVIAINASVIPRILSHTGPINMQGYNKTLSSDSALNDLQKAVELEYDRATNKPKQIIAELFPLLMNALSKGNLFSSPKFLSTILNAFKSRDIQVYLRDAKYEQLAKKIQIAGEMKDFNGDYSLIVSSNIGGAKTDSVISTDVDHTISFVENGMVDVTLELKRIHRGMKGDPFTGVQHNDYMRFYAPEGSMLISAQGFSEFPQEAAKKPLPMHRDDNDLRMIQQGMHHDDKYMLDRWNEHGKTVFAGWLFTKTQSESSVLLRYRIPYASAAYALLIQRQSGSTIGRYTVHFDIPKAYKVDWSYGGAWQSLINAKDISYYTDRFDSENYLGVSLSK